MNTKTCYNEECPEENPQPLTNFHKQSTGKLGVRSRCRTCHNQDMRERETSEYRRRKTLRIYGLSVNDFDRMLERQEGKCAICSIHQDQVLEEFLVVDHCHETGTVRQLLCNPCNKVLGIYKENIDRFFSSIAYIEKHNNLTQTL